MQQFCLCRCQLNGSGQQLTVGQPVTLTLHTADAYSNACWDSSDKVHVGLCGPTGTALTAAAVEDLRNGAYGISFTPDVAGRWTVLPRYFVQRLEQERKRKEKTMPFGINLMRSQVLYWAAQCTAPCNARNSMLSWHGTSTLGENMADLT
jgi:hypothetical protein